MDNLSTDLKIGPIGKSFMVGGHPHSPAFGHQTAEKLPQASDILGMQTHRRVIDEEDRPLYAASGDPRQLSGQLEAVDLSPRQGRCRLTEAHVSQADIVKGAEGRLEPGMARQEPEGLIHRECEDLVRSVSLPPHLEDIAVETPPVAYRTDQEHIRQQSEVHSLSSRSTAGLAPAPLYIQGKEPSG